MDERDYLDEYLELCVRMYERMVLEGTWPWPDDSTNPENVIDSTDNNNDA